MYDASHPAHTVIEQIGREINTEVKPKAVVVISAHWEADSQEGVEVNFDEGADLIYE